MSRFEYLPHEERVKAREADKAEILELEVNDFKLSNSLCKDHDRWFVNYGSRELVTCVCKVADSYIPINHNILGDALITATARIHQLEKALAEIKAKGGES